MGIENPVHLIFLAAVALLVLGPKRLPEVARALGQGLREFRQTMSGEVLHGHATEQHPPAAQPAQVLPAAVAAPAPEVAAPAPPADAPAPVVAARGPAAAVSATEVVAPAPEAAEPPQAADPSAPAHGDLTQ